MIARDRRKLAALAVCSAAYLSVLSCTGSEFSSGEGGAQAGQVSGGKSSGKAGSPAGSDSGGKAGGGTPGATGGGVNPSGGTDPDPGGAGEPMGNGGSNAGSGGTGGQPPVGPAIPKNGLVYWFAADVGVTQVLGVAKWADQSNNGYHAVQLLEAMQPKVTQTAAVPHPFLQFDGVDDYLELPELPADLSQGLSIFAIAGVTNNEGCSGYIELSNGSEDNDVHLGVHSTKLQYEVVEGTVTSADESAPSGELLLAEAHHGGAQVEAPAEVRINGVQANATVLSLPANVLRVANYIGRTLYINCVPFGGALGELIFYSRRVTADERVKIEQYLTGKWQCCG